jgi:type II secretory pathway pseudopilin PulG
MTSISTSAGPTRQRQQQLCRLLDAANVIIKFLEDFILADPDTYPALSNELRVLWNTDMTGEAMALVAALPGSIKRAAHRRGTLKYPIRKTAKVHPDHTCSSGRSGRAQPVVPSPNLVEQCAGLVVG